MVYVLFRHPGEISRVWYFRARKVCYLCARKLLVDESSVELHTWEEVHQRLSNILEKLEIEDWSSKNSFIILTFLLATRRKSQWQACFHEVILLSFFIYTYTCDSNLKTSISFCNIIFVLMSANFYFIKFVLKFMLACGLVLNRIFIFYLYYYERYLCSHHVVNINFCKLFKKLY